MKHRIGLLAALFALCLMSVVPCACQQEAPIEESVDVEAAFPEVSDEASGSDANPQGNTLPQEQVESPSEAEGADSEASASDKAEGWEDPEKEAEAESEAVNEEADEAGDVDEDDEADEAEAASEVDVEAMRAALNITEDYRDSFIHGPKPAEYQRYIMLHDTEGEADGLSVVSSWDGAGVGVAAHFIVNMDGSIVQCVDMDTIAHHAGFGDAGHNDLYGVPEDDRDDRVGTEPIGDWAPDYGMNSYSIGIEMVHVGGTGYYPEEQLMAVDALIAYIDAYYGGNGGVIIDHKAWRTGNSDTSPEFGSYLLNYQDHRTHL